MGKTTNIRAGEYAIGNKDSVISSIGIGSCMVICIYDRLTGMGGMAHSMLPSRKMVTNAVAESKTKDPKFVDDAIDILTSEMLNRGAKIQNLRAKLIGGASLFKSVATDNVGMGQKNIEIAREKLGNLNIPIKKEDVGGNYGRMVDFILMDGTVIVSTKTML